MDEFNGILQRHHMHGQSFIDLVEHRGKRRGLATARRTRDKDQTILLATHIVENWL